MPLTVPSDDDEIDAQEDVSNDRVAFDVMVQTAIRKYNVTDDAIAEMKAEFGGLKVKMVDGVEDKQSYHEVKAAHSIVRKTRTKVETVRKALKKDSIEYGRAIDAEAKRITELLLEIENPLKEQKDIVDERAKFLAAELAKRDQERIAAIQERIGEIRQLTEGLSFIQGSPAIAERLAAAREVKEEGYAFDEFHDTAWELIERTILQLEKEHDARVTQEKEKARLAEQQAEIDRQRAEMEAQKAKLMADAKKLQDAADAKKREEERAQFEAQAKIRAEQEAKEKAEREAREAAERAAAEKAEAERLEALKPEIERAKQYGQKISEQIPEMPVFEEEWILFHCTAFVENLNKVIDKYLRGLDAGLRNAEKKK